MRCRKQQLVEYLFGDEMFEAIKVSGLPVAIATMLLRVRVKTYHVNR